MEDGDTPKAEIGEGNSSENKEESPSTEEPAPPAEEPQAK